MNGGTAAVAGRRRHRRRPVMSEINVTPMVDVMLVLLIIFMVSAPLLTVGVPLDLPQTQAKTLDQDKEPLTVSVNTKGEVYLQNTEIPLDELVPKLKAITEAGSRAGESELDLVLRPKEKKGSMLKTLFKKKKEKEERETVVA